MGTAERRQREKEELKGKIIDAARELFATHGYESTTMRDVAQRIEYTPASIYLHFKDKQELLREICRVDFVSLLKSLAELSVIVDPLQRLRALGLAYVQFAVEHPHHYRLMFMTEHDLSDGTPSAEEADHESYNQVLRCVQEVIDAGLVRPEYNDSRLLAQILWAGVHGLVSLEIVKCKEEWLEWAPLEKRSNAILDALLQGVLAKN